MFEEELAYFIANQNDLVRRYNGKALILRGSELIGAFDNPLQAFLEGRKRFKPGTFMIQRCAPGPDAYTLTINVA